MCYVMAFSRRLASASWSPSCFRKVPLFSSKQYETVLLRLNPRCDIVSLYHLRTSHLPIPHTLHSHRSFTTPSSFPFAFPACFRRLPDGAMMQCCVAVLCWRACSHVSGRIMYHIWYYLIIMDHKLKKTEEIEEKVRQDRCSCSTIAGHLEPNRYTALQTWKGPFLELLGCYNLVIVINDGYLKKQATAKR